MIYVLTYFDSQYGPLKKYNSFPYIAASHDKDYIENIRDNLFVEIDNYNARLAIIQYETVIWEIDFNKNNPTPQTFLKSLFFNHEQHQKKYYKALAEHHKNLYLKYDLEYGVDYMLYKEYLTIKEVPSELSIFV